VRAYRHLSYPPLPQRVARAAVSRCPPTALAYLALLISRAARSKDEEKYKTGYVRPAGWTPTAPVKDYKATRRANPPAALDWQYTEAVTAIKNQGQCGSWCVLSPPCRLPPTPLSGSALTSMHRAGDPPRGAPPRRAPPLATPPDRRPPLLAFTRVRSWAFSATEAVESALVLSTGSQLRLELSPQQVTSCSPKIGVANPCLGCNGGTTEGAYDYLTTVTGLTNSFNLPYEQSLTATSKTVACPTAKIAAIDGPMMQLTGGYAAVSGYHYAVTPCTSGPCTSQDLAGLQVIVLAGLPLDCSSIAECISKKPCCTLLCSRLRSRPLDFPLIAP
jgi:hypothetical protein